MDYCWDRILEEREDYIVYYSFYFTMLMCTIVELRLIDKHNYKSYVKEFSYNSLKPDQEKLEKDMQKGIKILLKSILKMNSYGYSTCGELCGNTIRFGKRYCQNCKEQYDLEFFETESWGLNENE